MITEIQKLLFEKQELAYREFSSKLMPTVPKETVIGVRTPILRKLAKELYGTKAGTAFLQELPHRYFEENSLHGFMLEQIKDFDEALVRVEEFLPFVDNWSTCDSFTPKCFKQNPEKLHSKALEWLGSDKVYTVRYGIKILMNFFLEKNFKPEVLEQVASVTPTDYYVSMMIAWFFATALAKQYCETLPFIEKRRLDEVTHRRAVRKALESFRITEEQKAHLKTLK